MLYLSLALTPIFIIILYVYFQDKYAKEPKLTLFITFLLGIVAVIPAALIEMGYELFFNFKEGITIWITVLYSFFGVAFTEEFCKFLFLRWYIYKNKNFKEPMDAVVYSVFLSMGFAALENVFYVFFSDDPISTAIARSFTAVPAHATFGVIMGLYMGLARFTFTHKRVKYLWSSIIFASLAHGLYNLFLFFECMWCPLISILVLIILCIISLKIISRFKKISPFKKRKYFLSLRTKQKSLQEIEDNENRKNALKQKLKKILLKKRNNTENT
jgi:protease PrsW